jgi:alpha-ketoglutarate-dependent taurine dioxygenase
VSAILHESIEGRLEFLNQSKLPAVLTPLGNQTLRALLEEAKEPLAAILRRHGAILFRGFDLSTADEFHAVAAQRFQNELQAYVGGISPRGQVTSGVYESTRFPSGLRIPQHNEMSYLPDPPRELAFFCEVEPQHGGDTPLADSRLIYDLVPKETRDLFAERGIRYHRYLYGPRVNLYLRACNRIVELHNSWMDAFSTSDPAVVERVCAEHGETVKWDSEGGAQISSVLPAVRRHPETGEMLWFNQVSIFLTSPQSTGRALWLLHRIAHPIALRRPLHATLGDGTPISLRQLNQVNHAIDRATVRFRWRRGDLLLVDNYLVSHGRMPFRGERRILVAIR